MSLSKVSIPQGPINTFSSSICSCLCCVSIPQGPINTQIAAKRFNNFRMFQFRKVQLIPGSPKVLMPELSLFQFRKVQLIQKGVTFGDRFKSVSIPQGPINTLSSIQQSPL